MMLSELVEYLQDALEVGDREVLVAQQPNWPLTATVANVWDPAQDDGNVEDEDAEDGDTPWRTDVVWIATTEGSGQTFDSPYAPKQAWTS